MEDEKLIGGIEKRAIVMVDYDPRWPAQFVPHARKIQEALGNTALAVEHVGSTSVPGLAAKPIVDMIVVVPNAADEPSYLPALLAAGYVLRVREPDWHEHRMVRTPALDAHVHVFPAGCLEVRRQLAFRDRLRRDADDRRLYESTKRRLANQDWADMNAYARAKSDVVEQITARALADVAIGSAG